MFCDTNLIMFEDLLRPQHLLLILSGRPVSSGLPNSPPLGKGLAEGIKNFKDAIKGGPEPPPPPADKSQQSQDPPVKIV